MRIDVDLVRGLVARQFPQWAGLPVSPVEPGGWDNRTFRLGRDMSIRLPSHRAYAAQVEKEQAWLPRLAPRLPLPIPQPLAKGAPDAAYPLPWAVYRWLDGEPARREAIADDQRFARDLGRFLAALRAVDVGGGPPAGPHSFHRGGDLAVYDTETRAAVTTFGERVDACALLAVWEAALGSAWRGPPVWVHGDVAVGNLLVRDGVLSAVIDFGCMAVGDPACDLVIAWTDFTGEAREAFRETVGLDADTWRRARGWALWKALITAADQKADAQKVALSLDVLAQVLGG